MAVVGYFAFETRISCARIVRSTALRNASASKPPSMVRKCIRLSDARLQAESSRNMYSEQGLEPLIRSEAGQVCQALTVVSNWSPGSPQSHAAWATWLISARARTVSIVAPLVRAVSPHSRSSTTARMKESVARMEWLAFWKKTESYAPPFTLKPPS